MIRRSFFYVAISSFLRLSITGQYEDCKGEVGAINDGRCDTENNVIECDFDGGDCCECSCANDHLYPCGIWGFNCLDPGGVSNGGRCTTEIASVVPCSTDSPQMWSVNDTTSATSLAEAVNCSGGVFNVQWQGNVLVDRTFYIPNGTTVYVSGEGSGAEVNGGGKIRLFTVESAALYIDGLILRNGNSTYGGAIAATRSILSLNQTSYIGNVVSSYGGAAYIGRSSSVAWNGQTKLAENEGGRGGGAVAISTSSSIIWNGSTEFSNNTAAGDGGFGGAVYANDHSRVSWNGVASFTKNNASLHGGALYISDDSTASWDGMGFFVENTAEFGGAMTVDGYSSVSWTAETSFNKNTALSYGGALFVDDNSTASWVGVTSFFENTAEFGGSVFVDDYSSVSWTAETSFNNNSASSNGGALFIEEDSIAFWGGVTYFIENSADFGGGVFVDHYANVSWTVETYFISNNASLYGGAFFVDDNSSASWDGITIFAKNIAQFGGAVFVDDYSSVSWTAETSFNNNSASSNGGALFVEEDSIAFWDGITYFTDNIADSGGAMFVDHHSNVSWAAKTSYLHNTAISYGGAVYIDENSIAAWDGITQFVANTAGYGGAVSVNENSVASWTAESHFINNGARIGHGGALRVRFESSASWTGYTLFTGNNANSSGGAVYISTDSSFTMKGDTDFLDNHAAIDGGGIFVYVGYYEANILNVFLDDDTTVILRGNNCGANGGGIAFVGVLVTSLSPNIMFSENHAGVAGGAIYMSGVIFGPQFNGTKFYSNSAVVGGGVYSTGSGTVAIGEDENLHQNPTVFNGCEFIGNEATTAGGALNTGAGIDVIENSYFMNNTAAIGGALRLVGMASLSGCTFMDNLSDEYEGPGIFNDGIISSVSNCSFVGNVFNCEPGSYLEYNQTDALFDTICKGCEIQCKGCTLEGKEPMCLDELDHSSAAGGNTTIEALSIDPGYWRATNTSTDILACYNAEACMGGVTGEEGYCLEGHEGPYCSVCSAGYTENLGFACTKCSANINGSIAFATFVSMVLLFTFISFPSYMLSGKSEDADKGIVARVTRYIPLQSVKVVIVVWQILTEFSTVANVVFPSVYQDFLDGVNILNFDLSWVISVGCIIDTEFHDQLLFTTLGPLVCMAILGGTYVAAMRRTDLSEDARSIVRRKHVSMVLLLTFLVYSSVSSTLFKSFACDKLDDGKIYLRADYRIECDDSKHNAVEIYAGFMVGLYVVGIPSFYGVLLYNNREALMMNNRREDDESIKPITDLWKPYRPERFFYEVIECVRRVLLTGALVFIYPNTAAQIAVALIMATFFIFVSEALAPHASVWDTWCSRTGHAIVFTSMFLALLLKVDVSGERASSQRVFESVLIAAHSCLVLIVVVEAVAIVLAWRGAVDEESAPRIRPSLDGEGGEFLVEAPPFFLEARSTSGPPRSPRCEVSPI